MDKIINETTTEKVLSLGGVHTERKKRSLATTVMLVLAVAGCIGCIMFVPWKNTLAVVITAAVTVIICFLIYLKATASDSSNDPNQASVIRTGDTCTYRYEFTKDGFTVSGDAERSAKWEDISSVRNIGGAYQLKCGADNFTIKKQGFEQDGDEAFIALLKEKGIKII